MVCREGVWGNVYEFLRVLANFLYYILGIGLHAYRGLPFDDSSCIEVVAHDGRNIF